MTQELNKEGLLPCPFCGGSEVKHFSSSMYTSLVICRCGASMQQPNELGAINTWNTRSHAEAIAKGERDE